MKEKTTKLVSSIMVLVLCLSMFLGTTLAWFNDAEGSGNNQITAGNLDVTLEYLAGDTWVAVDETTNVFRADALWEPGHTEVVYLRTGNAGTLALQYQLGIRVAAETASVNADGERLVLSDHIQYAILEGVDSPFATREDALAAVTAVQPLSSGYTREGVLVAGMAPEYLAMVVFMPETVGNEANYATGAVAPSISLGISLKAVQMSGEADGFGDSYDSGVQLPGATLDSSITEPVLDKAENGVIVEEITVGDESDAAYAQIPQGVTLADGAEVLTLSVQEKAEPEASITVQENESVTALDIHVEGLAADNTVPMLVTLKNLLPTGLNTTSVTMYHVENGQPVAMTYAANPVNHNEFSYDAATGTVVLCVASFSEYVAVTDDDNPWLGKVDTDWYNTQSTAFSLNNAEQLAGLGAIVDGTADDIAADTFAGKTIYLTDDINMGEFVPFNPIGCGYVSGVSNSGGVEGRAFMGTFDGDGHTISNLYINGWDIGLEYCNLGGGLFASIANGTVKNLTITGAEIRMECVELGVLVGLSQGNCTYENINIYNSKIANYQRATGGLIGEVSAMNGGGTTTITDVTIGSDVTVGSMWGDFDAPCGGVIGARWDDANTTEIVMTNCVVAPRMDVYNDVTSSYQWYAYRRAGMLIGNTELVAEDGRTAAAPFLTCENVVVKYGNWVNYHYCEFNNYNSSWPFVRAEAGEYCDAFSNPRYGVPNDVNDKKVTSESHIAKTTDGHLEGDDHWVELPFNQLYGGGQGVYGQPEHDGVTIKKVYKVTFMDGNDVFATDYIEYGTACNFEKYEKPVRTELVNGKKVTFAGWVNAVGTKQTGIDKDNTDDVTVYATWNNVYTARFIDLEGNVIFTQEFTNKTTKLDEPTVPAVPGGFTGDWTAYDLSTATGDIVIKPVYNLDNGIISLEPILDTDGVTVAYRVVGYNKNATAAQKNLVVIPEALNGIPVTEISANAFSSYEGIHSVIIPENINVAGKNTLCETWGFWDDGETVTLYYAGSRADWIAKEATFTSGWDFGISESSRVFFLNGTDKVDPSEGYMTFKKSGSSIFGFSSDWKENTMTQSVLDGFISEYTGKCDCDDCERNNWDKPDKAYWEGVTLN